MFLLGLLLRLAMLIAYRDVLMFFGDSWTYLMAAQNGHPLVDRPYGYSALLRLLSWTHWIGTVAVVQHVMGLGLACVLYGFLLRKRVRPAVAAVAVAPVLLDAYQFGIEQYMLTETLFELLLSLSLVLLMRSRITWRTGLVAAALLSAAMLTRSVALPIAAIIIVYLLVRRAGMRPVAVFMTVMLASYAGYAVWFHHYHGRFAVQETNGRFLYGRVAAFASCGGKSIPPAEQPLCRRLPRGTPTAYAWSGRSPFYTLVARDGYGRANQLASRWAQQMILAQPITYARVVASDTVHFFAPIRRSSGDQFPVAPWRLPTTVAGNPNLAVAAIDFEGDYGGGGVTTPLARFLRDYQSAIYTYGPLAALALLAGLAGLIRRRAGPTVPRQSDVGLILAVAMSLLVIPDATVVFDYRYMLPAVPLLGLAATLGIARLWPAWVLRPNMDEGSHPPRPAAGHGPSQRRRKRHLTATLLLTSCLAAALAVGAPLHRNVIFDGYVSSGALSGPIGPPLAAVRTLPGLPGAEYQEYRWAFVVAVGRRPVVVPRAIAETLSPERLAQLGAPVACSPFRPRPLYWCYFDRGLVTVPAGRQAEVPPRPRLRTGRA